MRPVRLLRLGGSAALTSARVFEDGLSAALRGRVVVHRLADPGWRHALLAPDDPAGYGFASATAGHQLIAPDFLATAAAPLLAARRNRSGAEVALVVFAHAPAACPVEWALIAPLLRPGDRIVAPSANAAAVLNHLVPALGPYVRVIPHAIDLPARDVQPVRGRMLSFSRLHSTKLIHQAIDVLADVRLVDAELQLAGAVDSGPGRPSAYVAALRQRAQRLGVQDRVHWLGEITDPAVKAQCFGAAALLVCLSVSVEESFGKAAVEALACGVPVLATQWDGLPEAIGDAGVLVPVADSGFGMVVDVAALRDGAARLLDDPPDPATCLAAAARSRPEQVGPRYADLFAEALADRAAAPHIDGPVPIDEPSSIDGPAATGGLLAETAPLTGYGWTDLFAQHEAAVTGHNDGSEFAELRGLVIAALRRPVGRLMAGLEPGRPTEVIGSKAPSRLGTFLDAVAVGARSRATRSSRIACAGYLAGAGRAADLTAALADLGHWDEDAPALSVIGVQDRARVDGFAAVADDADRLADVATRVESAGPLLRQLCAIAGQHGERVRAADWLGTWLERFPDAPDVALAVRDLTILAGAGPADHVDPIEHEPPGRVELPDPVRALAARHGARAVEPLGASGRSHRLLLDDRSLVVKAMVVPPSKDQLRELFAGLSAQPDPYAPRLLDIEADAGTWYAAWDYLPGRPGPVAATLEDVLILLVRLRSAPLVPSWRIDERWLAILTDGLEDTTDRALLESLGSTRPTSRMTLAHGDVNLPNVIIGDRPQLIDWEEVGAAPAGFDAGWLLALGSAGVRFPWTADRLRSRLIELGFVAADLDWYEVLGLLRLCYRIQTADLADDRRESIRTVLRRALSTAATRSGLSYGLLPAGAREPQQQLGKQRGKQDDDGDLGGAAVGGDQRDDRGGDPDDPTDDGDHVHGPHEASLRPSPREGAGPSPPVSLDSRRPPASAGRWQRR